MEQLKVNKIYEKDNERESKYVDFKVRGDTNANSIGSCIDRYISVGKKVTLFAIGVKALNQAIKGIIIARRFLNERGKEVLVAPEFEDVVDKKSNEKIVRIKMKLVVDDLR